ncbi:MAG TPA: esterase-like activity of phytase family protein, partial [Kofleriaceae bacterium]|nr:esterase-like activity of phytase family protein [Kofleriaceae bacterium]
MRLLAAVALIACGKHHDAGVLDKQAAKGVFEEVRIDTPPGMSDLTIDDRGILWGIAERDRQVVEIDLSTMPPRTTAHPLDGFSPGVDTEALAWLGGGRFAIGTEAATEATASIAFAELQGDRLVVTHTRLVTSEELGVTITDNHGIESVCGSGDEVIAASESAGKLPDGTRFAALARLRGDALSVAKVRLTSDVGKLSALHCTLAPDGTADVVGIERHYSVSRIVRFTATRDAVEITPTVVLDLAPILRDSLNLEGIVRLPDGRLVAINDNQGKRTS